MNKFKLWLNRNNFKIIVIVFLVLSGYLLIKSGNNYYKNKKEDEEKQITTISETENTYNNGNNQDNENKLQDVLKVDKSLEEYEDVTMVVKNIINNVYQANKNNSKILKQNIYNMFSEQLICDLSDDEQAVNADNVLDFIFKVEDVEDFSIEEISKYYENNKVVSYAIVLIYEKDGEDPTESYMMINMDYNNRTFSYDGTLINMNNLDIKEINYIENKGSNTF